MSFGRPGGFSDLVNAPPDRGSFPLDHYGECKVFMTEYLSCLKKSGSTSTPCRALNKDYLECRMSKGLMERDDWHNLGMDKVGGEKSSSDSSSSSVSSASASDRGAPKTGSDPGRKP